MLIVITGTSQGIGFELVKKFAENPNNKIIAISRKVESLKKLNHKNVIVVKADITSTAGRQSISNEIKKQKIAINVLINNAGQILNKPFEKILEKELQLVYQTNLYAPFLLIQKLLPLFSKKEKSHIINISSMGGFQGSAKFKGLSAYSSSKGAVSILTECLAEELAEKNIAVNCLALGAVQTEMLAKAFPNYKAPLQASEMAQYIFDFALNGHKVFNGKILPVSMSTP
jgi:short-subunit dehydrogenase